MNKYARFDEIPSRTLKDIKERKCYGRTDGRTDGRTMLRTNGRTDGWTDNVKTVYPPTNTVCGGYNYKEEELISQSMHYYPLVNMYNGRKFG